MDRLDVRILRFLIQGQATSPLSPNFRTSYRTMAMAIGVDEGTLRYRVRRFETTGLIQDWRCYLNPRLWGGGETGMWFDVPRTVRRPALVEQLKLVPGVLIIALFFGRLIGVVFQHEDDRTARKRAELIRQMAGAERVALGRVPWPPAVIRLSSVDWGLIRSLFRNPRKPYAAIAKELDISTRTVKVRIRNLVEGGAVFVFPAVNPRAVRGALMASVMVTYPLAQKDEVDRAISSKLEPYLWHVFHMSPFEPDEPTPCHFNVMVPNVATLEDLLRWVRQMDGVATGRAELLGEAITTYEPLEALMEKGFGERVPLGQRSAKKKVETIEMSEKV